MNWIVFNKNRLSLSCQPLIIQNRQTQFSLKKLNLYNLLQCIIIIFTQPMNIQQ